ncbi:MAG: ABC transporter substrate-binding protein [Patescibacteria group bacterium]
MIFLKRKRLVFWLLKAYLKRWRKTILISFVIGLLGFFLLRYGVNYFIPLLPFVTEEKIGIEGAYALEDLPPTILSKVSVGLTKLDKNYNVVPAAAKRWEVRDNGKTYIFYLDDNYRFSDKTKLTSELIKYDFTDAVTQTPNKNTIIFKLKDSYSPFLVTVTRPIFKNGFVGIGDYKVQSIDLNGDFVQSVSLRSLKEQNKVITYQFYPTQEALKTAFALGEIDKALGLTDIDFENTSFTKYPDVLVQKRLDDQNLVTVFYNTRDKNLSDKRLRAALSYAIPDEFLQGKRNYGSFSPNSWVSHGGLTTYNQDFDHSKLLLSESDSFKSNKNLKFELKTFPKYKAIAQKIKESWEKVGIKVSITTVDTFPETFEMFLGDFKVPKDPDQYILWHSDQVSNITGYKNLRIDKLLEDGRQTIDVNERKKIYSDFQKYLLDDSPASFILFSYSFEVTRR